MVSSGLQYLLAQQPGEKKDEPKKEEPISMKIDVNGVYNVWALSQNNFFFGYNELTKSPSKEKDDYFVQMLRFGLKLSDPKEDIRVITRFDLAQGWWGVDNAGNQSFDNGQFYDKNTFFDVHIDHAYVDASARFMAGRMNWAVGNQLVLDDDIDGAKFSYKIGSTEINLGFAKYWESDRSALLEAAGTTDTTMDPKTNTTTQGLPSLNDSGSSRDANLFLVQIIQKLGEKNHLSLHYLLYQDKSTGDGTAFISNNLGYYGPRFSPQINTLNIGGISGEFNLAAITIKFEGDFLKGKDAILNTTYNSYNNDINDGNIEGFTALLDTSYNIEKGTNFGVKLGIGSGDDDPSQGKGNVTKLKTQGFFYFTEVWEDSIMPDVAGISPQGLGAPNTRGYREFENTTAAQVYANLKINKWLGLFVSYSYLQATKDVIAWKDIQAGKTVAEAAKSKKLGQEVDAIVKFSVYDNLTLDVRGGYFMAGDAAVMLVNGTTKDADGNGYAKNPWEIKTELTYKF
jgi:hypothetical protein